jgi:hypothetical protein
MELKSKSLLITTQSNSKNYDFDSQAHNDTHIADFNLLSK